MLADKAPTGAPRSRGPLRSFLPLRPAALVGACLVLLWFGPHGLAGGRPEGVVVVVNEDSWASTAVANEFIHLRRIPASNVVYLKLNDLPNFETVDAETFRARILTPVLDAIRDRGLADHIDCIAYCPDIPYAVGVGKDVGEVKLPQVVTPTAAVNGLTYLHRFVQAKDAGKYLALNANWYFRMPKFAAPTTADAPWTRAEQESVMQAAAMLQAKKWAEGQKLLSELLKSHPNAANLHYNLACSLAQQGKPDEAVASLRRAAECGWGNREHAEKDEDLKPIRTHKDYRKVLEMMKPPRAMDVQAPRGFRGSYAWKRDGELAPGGEGASYLLSTMLAVTSGRGSSVREAVECLRRAAAADGTHPSGTVCFMVNDDIRSRTRQYGFDGTIAKLKGLGVAAEAVSGTLPTRKNNVAGLMAGSAGFDWPKSGSTILPGAICEHLTSTGGVMTQRAGQTCISEWIRHGAAGTSGTVTEPYAIQNKFPTPFIHYFYASGCTLAESFYQSVYGPYQLLIVGDPICRPWAGIPRIVLESPKPGETVKGKLVLRPEVKEPSDYKVARYDLFVNGHWQQRPPGKELELDTTTLSDGWYDVRVSVTGADPIETQGDLAVPIFVNNRGLKPELTPPSDRKVIWGSTVRLKAAIAGAKTISLHHNGRQVGTIAGENGEVEIDTRRLGLGPVRIQAVGRIAPGKPSTGAVEREGASGSLVASEPLELEVLPPPALPSVRPPTSGFSPGLKVTPRGKGPVGIRELKQLADAGVRKGEPFVLEGHFDVPSEDVYQFQVWAEGSLGIRVDDKPLDLPEGKGWKFVPITLAGGTHSFRAEGKLDNLSVDIRFGGPGAYSLSDASFRYTGPATTLPAPTTAPSTKPATTAPAGGRK